MPLPSWPPVPLATGTMDNATNFPGPPKGGEDECGKNDLMFFLYRRGGNICVIVLYFHI